MCIDGELHKIQRYNKYTVFNNNIIKLTHWCTIKQTQDMFRSQQLKFYHDCVNKKQLYFFLFK